jgi:hypothetical protein
MLTIVYKIDDEEESEDGFIFDVLENEDDEDVYDLQEEHQLEETEEPFVDWLIRKHNFIPIDDVVIIFEES